jgi:hypothetical protein
MAGTVIADRLEAQSTSQLVIENGVALTPPTIVDVNNVQIGTFCRAWVNFNGTGTVAIRASFNVSSITDNGTGDYTVNFTNAMPDANYQVSGAVGVSTSVGPIVLGLFAATASGTYQAPTVSAFRLQTRRTDTQAVIDEQTICISVFR